MCHCLSHRGVCLEQLDGIANGINVRRLHHDGVFRVEDVPIERAIGRDDRQPACHGFYHCIAAALVERGKHEDVGSIEVEWYILMRQFPLEDDAGTVRFIGTGSEEYRLDFVVVASPYGLCNAFWAFAFVEPSDESHYKGILCNPQLAAARCLVELAEQLGVDGIGDDFALAFFCQSECQTLLLVLGGYAYNTAHVVAEVLLVFPLANHLGNIAFSCRHEQGDVMFFCIAESLVRLFPEMPVDDIWLEWQSPKGTLHSPGMQHPRDAAAAYLQSRGCDIVRSEDCDVGLSFASDDFLECV